MVIDIVAYDVLVKPGLVWKRGGVALLLNCTTRGPAAKASDEFSVPW